MKKSLFALAALTAVAGAAQAQSSVTLYGALDASVNYISNGQGGTGAAPVASSAGSTTSPATSNVMGMVDSAYTSSIWGLKGSEDLGGGNKAIFDVQGDLSTFNGSASSAGIFRRASYVGVSSSTLGELTLGLRINPFLVATGGITQGGNSIGLTSALGGGYAAFFNKNAVTYTMPATNGVTGQIQYGMSNDADGMSGGSVYAGNLNYEAKGLKLTVAGQKINAGGTNNSAAAYASGSAASYTPFAALGDIATYMASAKYTQGQWTGALGFISNTMYFNSVQINQTVGSIAYQATPKLNLSLNGLTDTTGSRLGNVVALYQVSPRTSLYSQVVVASNGNGVPNANGSAAGSSGSYGSGLYGPLWQNNTVGATMTGASAQQNTTQTTFGVGVVHRF